MKFGIFLEYFLFSALLGGKGETFFEKNNKVFHRIQCYNTINGISFFSDY